MISARRTEKIAGVEVDMLFTPHLYSLAPVFGITMPEGEGTSNLQAIDIFADILFLSCVNAWQLDGHGDPESFPLKRGDIHAWMTEQPTAAGKALRAAVLALSGKTLQEISDDEKRAKEEGVKSEAPEGEGKKKLFGTITRRSRSSS